MKGAKSIALTFVTGNPNKLLEFQQIFKIHSNLQNLYTVTNSPIDLDELQGDSDFVALRKVQLASSLLPSTPVIIEDVSLNFTALNGLPGPYIKTFLSKLGREGLYSLIEHQMDKSAVAQCIYAYQRSPTDEARLFIGECRGQIVRPRGGTKFGWDPIFMPDDGNGETFGEMDPEQKNKISHRAKALRQVADFLVEEHGRIRL
ncbi:hypothetical protein FGO68_gene4697 [Halteria grandinella]|uniref:XTP/dITP diphosphatase n=1 Tax=Halteria grandinella TaxID=5974 RepID=A0A8J8NIU7_HALGN|nr:hypothetical protein FGO68_gene4697 [Halteria grandinella]